MMRSVILFIIRVRVLLLLVFGSVLLEFLFVGLVGLIGFGGLVGFGGFVGVGGFVGLMGFLNVFMIVYVMVVLSGRVSLVVFLFVWWMLFVFGNFGFLQIQLLVLQLVVVLVDEVLERVQIFVMMLVLFIVLWFLRLDGLLVCSVQSVGLVLLFLIFFIRLSEGVIVVLRVVYMVMLLNLSVVVFVVGLNVVLVYDQDMLQFVGLFLLNMYFFGGVSSLVIVGVLFVFVKVVFFGLWVLILKFLIEVVFLVVLLICLIRVICGGRLLFSILYMMFCLFGMVIWLVGLMLGYDYLICLKLLGLVIFDSDQVSLLGIDIVVILGDLVVLVMVVVFDWVCRVQLFGGGIVLN